MKTTHATKDTEDQAPDSGMYLYLPVSPAKQVAFDVLFNV